jgi:hypothetical protein
MIVVDVVEVDTAPVVVVVVEEVSAEVVVVLDGPVVSTDDPVQADRIKTRVNAFVRMRP